ncbi:right-handed parallel beta-helix repeat-containing protein, partial [Streptomyces sp. NPDC057908]|uniref:right-handed parallel beta-helix repeat-containing protein n=1 Tax=Streptomyces sp. NPDC057908 TaxID=3346276 RepID=UPI0036EFBBB4
MRVGRSLLPATVVMLLVGAAGPAAATAAHGDDRPIRVPCDSIALAQAIIQANTQDGGTLSLARNCDYRLTSAFSGVDGLPAITEEIRIRGNDATIERKATAPFRIFDVAGPDGRLALDDLTVKEGKLTASGDTGAGILVGPGAVLVLDDTTVSDNASTDRGGGISNSGSVTLKHSQILRNTSNGEGGGIFNTGELRITDSRLSDNSTTTKGGALSTEGGTTTTE